METTTAMETTTTKVECSVSDDVRISIIDPLLTGCSPPQDVWDSNKSVRSLYCSHAVTDKKMRLRVLALLKDVIDVLITTGSTTLDAKLALLNRRAASLWDRQGAAPRNQRKRREALQAARHIALTLAGAVQSTKMRI